MRERNISGRYDADRTHYWTVEVMKQYASYYHLISAALAQDSSALLPVIAGSTVSRPDSNHLFAVHDQDLVTVRPNTPVLKAGDDAGQIANDLTALLNT